MPKLARDEVRAESEEGKKAAIRIADHYKALKIGVASAYA
jgi:hypothetical protein